MFNVSTIQSEFITLVGARRNSDPAATINPIGDILTASSGLYFNDEHPLLTIQALTDLAPVFSDFTYSAYNAGTTYAKGQVVTSGGNYYISLSAGNTGNAVNNTTYWRQTTPFNEWLRERMSAAAIQVVNDWISIKFQNKTAANLLKHREVIQAPGYDTGIVGATEDYVGFRVVPSPFMNGVVLTVDRIAIQMVDSEQTVIELYKNAGTTPVQTLTIEGDGTSDVIWADAGWELEPGNFYYVVFDRSALSATPINAVENMDRYSWAYNRFPGILPYAEISAFDHAGPGNAGWTNVVSRLTNTTNYGLNLQISARCDYTQFITDRKNQFAQALSKKIAINFLRELAFNAESRVNRTSTNVNYDVLKVEIDGHPNGRKAGLSLDYENILKTITFDERGIADPCLPCRKNKIIIGAA